MSFCSNCVVRAGEVRKKISLILYTRIYFFIKNRIYLLVYICIYVRERSWVGGSNPWNSRSVSHFVSSANASIFFYVVFSFSLHVGERDYGMYTSRSFRFRSKSTVVIVNSKIKANQFDSIRLIRSRACAFRRREEALLPPTRTVIDMSHSRRDRWWHLLSREFVYKE